MQAIAKHEETSAEWVFDYKRSRLYSKANMVISDVNSPVDLKQVNGKHKLLAYLFLWYYGLTTVSDLTDMF